MSPPDPIDPRLRAPTLTEVLDVPFPDAAVRLQGVAGPPPSALPPPPSSPAVAAAEPPPGNDLDADRISAEVLAQVQRRIDQMLEYRLRELLAPILARTADTLVQEARVQLAATLRDVLQRAVAQEISRHRGK